jgi:hypothetical protein
MTDETNDEDARLWAAAQPASNRPSINCPDANELAAFAVGNLNVRDSARIEAHAARCTICSSAIASAALAQPGAQPNFTLGRRQNVFKSAAIAAACVCVAAVGALAGSATARFQQNTGTATAAQFAHPLADKGIDE